MSTIRLTLRTLLAYLDDTLPVSEARVIGAKLAENPETQELVERIRKVIRKRSMPVPNSAKDGSPSDPNTVAEYLSDALKAEPLAQFETTCLEQDIHLAEVSACHQILTLVLCEQVRIPPTARQRMYQLVKGRESIPNRKPGATIPIGGVVEDSELNEPEDDDIALMMGLQSYPKSDSWSKFGTKVGVIAVLFALFGVALWMALPPARSPETGAAYALLTRPVTPATQARPSPPTASSPPTSKSPDALPTIPILPPDQPKDKDLETMPKPTPVPVSPDMPPPADPPVPTPTPMPTDPPPQLNPTKPDLVPEAPAPLQDRVQLGKTDNPKAIVVKKNPVADQWVRILPEDPFFISTDRLLAMPGYKAALQFDSEVTIELWGNLPELLNAPITEAAVTPYLPADGIDADLQVHTGRLYLSTKKKNGAKLLLRFRNELWELTLKDEKTEVLFELFVTLIPGTQDLSRATVGLAVLEGELRLKDRYQPEVTISKGGEARWDSREGIARMIASADAKLSAEQKIARTNYLARLPLYPASTRPTLQALAAFSQQLLDPKQVRAVFDAALSSRPNQAVTDQDQAAARIAVLAFAALGDVRGLADALNDPSRSLIRVTAAQGLRSAIAAQPKLAAEFRQVLVEKNRIGDEAADAILLLLRGVSPRQRQVSETFDRLLAGLASPSVAVRELSLELLAQNYLQPDDKGLQPLLIDVGAPPDIREAWINAWKKRAEEFKARAAEEPKEGQP